MNNMVHGELAPLLVPRHLAYPGNLEGPRVEPSGQSPGEASGLSSSPCLSYIDHSMVDLHMQVWLELQFHSLCVHAAKLELLGLMSARQG